VRETFGSPDRNPWLLAIYKDNDESTEQEKARVRAIAEDMIEEESTRKRIVCICEEWRTRLDPAQVLRAPYATSLLVRPDAITWREFYAALDTWKKDRQPQVIASWIKEHAPERGASAEAVAAEFMDTLFKYYSDRLEFAAGTTLVAEHERAMGIARDAIELLSQLLLSGMPGVADDLATEPNITRFLEIAEYWINFNVNEADAAQREAEKAILLELVSGDTPIAGFIGEILAQQREHAGFDGAERRRLIDDLIAAHHPRKAVHLIERLQRDGGFSGLRDRTKNYETKVQMLAPNGPLWRDQRAELEAALKEAAENEIIQKNAIEWLELIDAGLGRGIGVEEAMLRAAIGEFDQMSLLWAAAVARPFQFRMLKGFREMRDHFLAAGASPDALPMPEWLKAEASLPSAEPERS
jgi:hypothetical protein